MSTHEYPADLLELERRSGWLICRCVVPIPEQLTLWKATQCNRCGRKVVS